MGALKSIAVVGCVAVGTLLLGRAEAQQVPVKAPQTAEALYQSAKEGNAAALRQLRTLAGAGNADAQFNLGLMYESGESAPKDAEQDVSWFRKAAEQGDSGAQFNLGVMYSNGEGASATSKSTLVGSKRTRLRSYSPSTGARNWWCKMLRAIS